MDDLYTVTVEILEQETGTEPTTEDYPHVPTVIIGHVTCYHNNDMLTM